MKFEFLSDALTKFTNEYLLATVILCVLLAGLAVALFGKGINEKIQFSVFVIVAVFFASLVSSFAGLLHQATPSPSKTSPSPKVETPPSAPVSETKPTQIVIPASSYRDGDGVALGPIPNLYGPDVLMNGPPFNARPNSAKFDATTVVGGKYLFSVRLAAGAPRPMDIYVNGSSELAGVLGNMTGGWLPIHQRWIDAGTIELLKGHNTITLRRNDVFPHITRLKLTPVAAD